MITWKRSRHDRILFGVCAGLAEKLGVPILAVRIAFLVLAIASGLGLLLYAALALILPLEGAPSSPFSLVVRQNARRFVEESRWAWQMTRATVVGALERRQFGGSVERRTHAVGFGLLLLGLVLLLGSFGLFDWLTWGRLFALLLVAGGTYVLARTRS